MAYSLCMLYHSFILYDDVILWVVNRRAAPLLHVSIDPAIQDQDAGDRGVWGQHDHHWHRLGNHTPAICHRKYQRTACTEQCSLVIQPQYPPVPIGAHVCLVSCRLS